MVPVFCMLELWCWPIKKKVYKQNNNRDNSGSGDSSVPEDYYKKNKCQKNYARH